MQNIGIPDELKTEYGAIRDEILFRLKAQQDIIKFTFAVAGLLAPLLGVMLNPSVNRDSLFAVLLIGPIICIFLKAVYLKHHVFIELLSSYISKELSIDVYKGGKGSKHKVFPFSGWEKYLTSSFYRNWRASFITALLGLSEAEFPILIGVLYLVMYHVLGPPANPSKYSLLFLNCWFIADCIGLFFIVFSGVFLRRWVAKRRRSNTKP